MATYSDPSGLTSQIAFQFFKDEVSLNGAGAYAPRNSSPTLPWNSAFRLRLRISRDVGAPAERYLLEAKVGNGSWFACESGQQVYIALSSYFADGEATTERLNPGYYPFAGGEGIETTRSSASYSSNSADYEIEWNLRIASQLPTGTIVYFRAVAVSSAWSGGQGYSAALLDYVVTASLVVDNGGLEVMKPMFEVYTEVGLAREALASTGKMAVASRKVNATTRIPLVMPEGVVWGGFRGLEVPVNATHGRLPPFSFTMTCEVTPQLLALLLCSLLGIPTTTGASDPFTHTFSPDGNPRTVTLWQLLHYASDESGNPPIYAGYGGCILSGLTLSFSPEGGGVVTAELEFQGLSVLMHNSGTNTGMANSSFFSGRPFVPSETKLTVRSADSTSPTWEGEITALRLRITRGVFPKWKFVGKRVATGWRYHRRAQVADLSMDVYRVGAKPMKLVWGQPENASFPMAPSPGFQEYNPATQSAIEIVLAYSDNETGRKVTISIPRVGWVAHALGPGGDNPDYDTFTLIPLQEGSSGSNFTSIVVLNDLNAAGLWTDDSVIVDYPSSPYLP